MPLCEKFLRAFDETVEIMLIGAKSEPEHLHLRLLRATLLLPLLFLLLVEVLPNVADFHPGEIVSGEGHVVCGRCRNCLAGRRHLCAHTQGIGVNRSGAFAEYLALPMTNVWHHAPQMNLEVASIFDPFGNAVHTALSFPVLGEDVLVTGAGPIGIMAAAVVRHAGARHVVVTDLNPYRLDLARRMGATLAVDPRQTDLAAVQKQLEMTEGFDVGLEMSGS
ncbi:MAG: threonine 3-dehydrogenase, partial [Candidatus Peregrinibacteria bacterium Greene0416_62]